MADARKLMKSVDDAISSLNNLKEQIMELGEKSNATRFPAPRQAQPAKIQSVVETSETSNDFEKLKVMMEGNKWPAAVNQHLICNPHDEEEKVERGRGVIELMVEEDLKGLSFLDFGCGEGHCANVSIDFDTKTSVGYDTKYHNEWDRMEKVDLILTDDFERVLAAGPYDVIIMFDVLDHLVGDNPVSVLSKVKGLLSDKGKVYMRVHPWTSRHASHLYHDVNKAFLHLVFTEEELNLMFPNSKFRQPCNKINTPLKTYGEYIQQAGLSEINRREITEKVEPFFHTPEVADRICKSVGLAKFPDFQCSLQFIDYVLKKA